MRKNHINFAPAIVRGKLHILAGAIALLPAVGWSQQYSVKDLGNFGGGSSTATAVNNAGQVAGYSPTDYATEANDGFFDTAPFVYSNGVMNTFSWSDQNLYNFPLAMNNSGMVVGQYFSDSGAIANAFELNGGFENLAPAQPSFADAINDNGVAVGADGFVQGAIPINGFLSEGIPIGVIFKAGAVIDIPKGPYLAIKPTGINNAEQISGLCFDQAGEPQGCIVSNGTQKLLPPAPAFSGKVWAYPSAINASGSTCGYSYLGMSVTNIAGTYFAATATAATYWKNGIATLLGHPANSKDSVCSGMDDFNSGVGSAISKTEGQIGVIYDPIHGARDLNKLISHIFVKGHGFTIQNAVSISDTGFIAAQCLYQNGINNACLLTPNAVLILHDGVLTLGENASIVCVPCQEALATEAKSLPKSLDGLTADGRARVAATVDRMGEQIVSLERGGDISQSNALFLIHEAELTLAQLQVRR